MMWRLTGKGATQSALTSRESLAMFIFGFASGLPYMALIVTLNAWLVHAGVGISELAVISWIGLAYAFKFLWSPLLETLHLPGLYRLGHWRSWIAFCQVMVVATLWMLAESDPVHSRTQFVVLAAIAAFASATQDIAIDAWRIETGKDNATSLARLAAVYQTSYRVAMLLGGAGSLALVSTLGWAGVYRALATLMALTIIGVFVARAQPEQQWRRSGATIPALFWPQFGALLIVTGGWAWALFELGRFLLTAIGGGGQPGAPTSFLLRDGPLIIALTVLVPLAVVGWAEKYAGKSAKSRSPPLSVRNIRIIYETICTPFGDLNRRHGLRLVSIIPLVLAYRLTDLVWAPLLYPFFLDELGFSEQQVALVYNIVGIVMLIAGTAVGAVLVFWVGLYRTLAAGAILAGVSNLLYADLGAGAIFCGAVARLSGLTWLLGEFGADLRLGGFIFAVAGESVATGLAGAVFVAYLSSLVDRAFGASQFALLVSLTFLLGSIVSGAMGDVVEQFGYTTVFRLSSVVGIVAAALAVVDGMLSKPSRRKFRQTVNDETSVTHQVKALSAEF